jgi:transglutaminase-like putative cysteine protease
MNLGALRHLPRDARDTLFELAVIAWTILPHAAHLPWWCVAMSVAILLWRARLALANAALPGRWVVAAVLAVALALTLVTERTLLGKDAGVTMLVVLMSLKTLELRARRDAMVIFFLGFFLVLTHYLYSQSLLVALSTVLAVWGLLTALVLAHLPVGRPPLAQAAGLAGRAALLGAPAMVVLFVLFPRFGPLWGLPQDAAGRTGLSGTLRLGGVAEVANDESVALRIRFDGPAPAPEALYFRGPVLGNFDGREWTRTPIFVSGMGARNRELRLLGQGVRYEMTVEPSRLAMLPLLELTPDMPGAAPEVDGFVLTLRPELEWQTDRPIVERLRFTAQAWPVHQHGPRGDVAALQPFRQLPARANPRARQWAGELRARADLQGADGKRLAAALLEHIRNGGYSYTLEPGSYGDEAIDEFWFDRKLGFCEHFAASFVFLMRTLGVPARIVTGYQGTDPLPQDGYYLVRQSHAHAWAEYWQVGAGWVRVDPTAAVAPDRIQHSRNLPPARGLVASALDNVSPALAAELRALWETVNNRWNQYVLNYSRGQQFDLLRRLGFEAPSWNDLAFALLYLMSAAALAGALWALWDRYRQDPWARLQRRIQQRLAQLGVEVALHHPPRTRAQLVRQRLGERGTAVAAALEELDRERYGGSGVALRWWSRFEAAAAHAAPRAAA